MVKTRNVLFCKYFRLFEHIPSLGIYNFSKIFLTYTAKTLLNNVQHLLLKKKKRKNGECLENKLNIVERLTSLFDISCKEIISPSAHIIVILGLMATLPPQQDDLSR